MTVKCICKQCGKEFESKSRKIPQKYCSRTCHYAVPKAKLKAKAVCKTCGIIFELRPCDIRKGRGKYCSRKCYGKSIYTGGKEESKKRKIKRENQPEIKEQRKKQIRLHNQKPEIKTRRWKKRHISPIRFKPISTEELNKILSGDDEE